MPTISLTPLVDFVCKAGTPKLTVVRNAKEQLQAGYDPVTDFYKAVRDRIVEMHKLAQPKTMLDTLLTGLADKKKQTAYPPIVDGYKKYLGKKVVTWFDPPRDEWTHGDLKVNINPELGLTIDGKRYAIKLYFKSDKLAKMRVAIVTQLMEMVLADDSTPMIFGVLDVRNAKFFSSCGVDPGLTALLMGEAASFAQIYEKV